MKLSLQLPWALVALALSCSSRPAATASGPSCEERQAQLVSVLNQLPRETLATPIQVPLAQSTLRGLFGSGAILTISDNMLLFNGEALPGETRAEQLPHLAARLAATATKSDALHGNPKDKPSTPAPEPLYLAAERNVDVRQLHQVLAHIPSTRDVRLLFAAPPPPAAAEPDTYEFPARVLAEPNAQTRHALAAQGYAEYSDCAAVEQAVASVQTLNVQARWPALQQAMLKAVPSCACDDIDADGLRLLLAAEQRAGTVALGSVPISFLREQRCVASMPLRSVQQVLEDIDEFDAQFAGDWKEDALHFDDVVNNERLLNVLCVALPGETLASLQRENATLYWKIPGNDRCQAWRFEPLARGAPLGTWRRAAEDGPPLAMHYRQGAEDLRLFGPVTDPKSRASDAGPWPCDQDFHLLDQSKHSVTLETSGEWFWDRAACDAAPSRKAQFPGCVSSIAGGAPPPALPVAPSTATPTAGSAAPVE